MNGLGIAQNLALLVCAIATASFLGLSRQTTDFGFLVLIGAFFIAPTVVVAMLTLQEMSIEEILLQGKAGITFAIPLGIGFGFILSAAGSLARKKDRESSGARQE